ncbi:MAG: PhzF family phenazine biosynthesis protein [Janthinobacterium lividum]
MNSIPFYIADSFTRTRYAGNPAGVVLPDAPMTDAQMQTVAGELHVESAFVTASTSPEADYDVVYYTSAKRIPLCGHDTIALVTVLHQINLLPASGTVRLATDVGVLSVSRSADGRVTMRQALPRYGQIVPAADAADALGLPLSEIEATGLPVQVVSTGTPFLIVPVTHRAALSALAPDMAALVAYGDSLPDYADGFYLWSPETISSDAQIHARCYAPAAGLPEDPITGTASGAVGAYLARHNCLTPSNDGVLSFRTEQGYDMGRPGNAEVCIRSLEGEVTSVEVSGYAVVVAEGKLWI